MFLQIGSHDRPGGTGTGSCGVDASVAPSSGATKGAAADERNAAQVVITVSGRAGPRGYSLIVQAVSWSLDYVL